MNIFDWFAGFMEKVAEWVCCEKEMALLYEDCKKYDDSKCDDSFDVTRLNVIRFMGVTVFSCVLAVIANAIGKDANIECGFLFFVMELFYFLLRWKEHGEKTKNGIKMAIMGDKWHSIHLSRLLLFCMVMFGMVDFIFISCVSSAAGVGFFEWSSGPEDVANMYCVFFMEACGAVILTYFCCASMVYYYVGKIYLKSIS